MSQCIEVDIRTFVGTDNTIYWSMATPTPITGWTLKFVSTAGITKTSGTSGFTITDTATGTGTIQLDRADSVNVAAGVYRYSVDRTDAGYEDVLTRGKHLLEDRRQSMDLQAILQHVRHTFGIATFDPRYTGMPRRSPQWPHESHEHLLLFPNCAACWTKKFVVVHHIEPFWRVPSRELDPTNLLTLCESPSHNCHLIFGHFLNWKSWNPNVVAMAAAYLKLVQSRPS